MQNNPEKRVVRRDYCKRGGEGGPDVVDNPSSGSLYRLMQTQLISFGEMQGRKIGDGLRHEEKERNERRDEGGDGGRKES